jgi:phage terminase small subunit
VLVSELNNRQELFVSFYLQNPNATQAAIKAGYSEKQLRLKVNAC